MSAQAPAVRETVITRERAVAPPDRFISVPDAELMAYFTGNIHALSTSHHPKLP
jgi:hypothetical protein